MRHSNFAGRLLGIGLILAAALALPAAAASEPAATPPSPQATEDAFQEALQALASGDAPAAIRIFRAILARQPDLPRVRLELARAYFVAREWENARREFFAVLSGDVPDTVRTNIIRFLRAIDARRGFDWNLTVGITASPQGARSYDTDIVDVDVFGTHLPFELERNNDGEYGARVSGNVEYRHEFSGISSARLRVTGLVEGFFDVFEGNGTSADDLLIGAGVGLRGAWPQTTVTGKAVVSTRDYGGRHYQDRYEFRGAAEWRSRKGLSLFASAAAGYVDDFLADPRDGRTARLRTGVARSIGGRSIAGVALIAEDYDADARYESYLTLGAELFGSTDLGGGFDATGRVFFLNQDYATNDPFLFETRKETEIGFDLTFSKTDVFLFGQFTPFVSVGYSRRKSSIDAYSYHENRFNIGLRKSF